MSYLARPASPSAHSDASSEYSAVSSAASASSGTSSDSLVYSRDELLAIGTSPLSHITTSLPILEQYPQIMRRTRRGLFDAQQAIGDSPRGIRSSSPGRTPNRRPKSPHTAHDSSSKDTISASQRKTTGLEPEAIPPMLKTGVYIPPPLRAMLAQQRNVPGRNLRQSRGRRLPNQSRPIAV